MEGNIFINYRKEDTGQIASVIYKALCNAFGNNNVFKDFHTTEPGSDFSKPVKGKGKRNHLLLVLIGKDWLSTGDSGGRLHINSDDDYIRLEIASALKNKVIVLPLMIDSAKMPDGKDLPYELNVLTRLPCINMHSQSFEKDIFHVIHVIKSAMGRGGKTDSAQRFAKQNISAVNVLKPNTNKYWSIACIGIGLLMVLTDQQYGNFPGVILGFMIIGGGAYAYFSGTQVQKQWTHGNFEAAKNFSRNAGIVAISTLIAGILLALLLEILTAGSNF